MTGRCSVVDFGGTADAAGAGALGTGFAFDSAATGAVFGLEACFLAELSFGRLTLIGPEASVNDVAGTAVPSVWVSRGTAGGAIRLTGFCPSPLNLRTFWIKSQKNRQVPVFARKSTTFLLIVSRDQMLCFHLPSSSNPLPHSQDIGIQSLVISLI